MCAFGGQEGSASGSSVVSARLPVKLKLLYDMKFISFKKLLRSLIGYDREMRDDPKQIDFKK